MCRLSYFNMSYVKSSNNCMEGLGSVTIKQRSLYQAPRGISINAFYCGLSGHPKVPKELLVHV